MWKKNKMYVKLTQEQALPDEPLLCEKCLNIERVHNRFLSKSNARAHFDEMCEAIFSYLQRCFNNLRSFCPGFSQASRRTSLYLSCQIQKIYFITRAGKGKHIPKCLVPIKCIQKYLKCFNCNVRSEFCLPRVWKKMVKQRIGGGEDSFPFLALFVVLWFFTPATESFENINKPDIVLPLHAGVFAHLQDQSLPRYHHLVAKTVLGVSFYYCVYVFQQKNTFV